MVAYVDTIPVGCGCWKKFNEITAEIKRMFVLEEYRHMGIAKGILRSLEQHAMQAGCQAIVLETGAQMPDAIAFY